MAKKKNKTLKRTKQSLKTNPKTKQKKVQKRKEKKPKKRHLSAGKINALIQEIWAEKEKGAKTGGTPENKRIKAKRYNVNNF